MTKTLVTLSLGLLGISQVACRGLSVPAHDANPARLGVTRIRPRCAEVASCLLGQVVTARTARPLAGAAVFLEQEPQDPATQHMRFVRLTDEQGIFTVANLPLGRYRMAIYKDAGREEVRGIELGEPGTTMIAVRLPID